MHPQIKINVLNHFPECTLRAALAAMKQIADNGPVSRATGICFNATKISEDAYIYDLVDALSRLWPKYSGESGYPVAGSKAYAVNHGNRDVWNKDTEYGQLRWELLYFLIDQLETILEGD